MRDLFFFYQHSVTISIELFRLEPVTHGKPVKGVSMVTMYLYVGCIIYIQICGKSIHQIKNIPDTQIGHKHAHTQTYPHGSELNDVSPPLH